MRVEQSGPNVIVRAKTSVTLTPAEAEQRAAELNLAAGAARNHVPGSNFESTREEWADLPNTTPGALYRDQHGTIYIVADPETVAGASGSTLLWRLDRDPTYATARYWQEVEGVSLSRLRTSAGRVLEIFK